MKFAVMTTNSSLFNLICQCFGDDTIECSRFHDDVALSRAIYREDYHAILVDAATGIDSTRAVFARRACYGDRRAPLIVVGAFPDRDSIERAFEAGADDVVLSPVDRSELAARTFLALRRFQSTPAAPTEDWAALGPYKLDRRAGVVLVNDHIVRLTVREFAIAWLLFSRAGEYVSRRQIAGAIWSSTEDIVGRTLEQHIYKLRKKLGLNGASGVQLRTMYAHGYRVELCDALTEIDLDAAIDTGHPLTAPPRATRRSQPVSNGVLHVIEAVRDAEAALEDEPPLCRASRPLDVHPHDSEAARTAQPWGQYAALWSLGALSPVNLVANFVAPASAKPNGDSAAYGSLTVPAALLRNGTRQRR
ncbi:DNA-binding response regulator, OmpR family, contains REC and winged-helix (wHTH) domain [Paraburkholderia phenazinium]|uniref:DNA-binding response regulator, OmpR family, contains REC and winged-helix (WHTH) domain n=1 Tax=Paraburkholderia phenazinium TaxID=60549 RepID=A0A1G8B7J9_9BURK|nr:DNA-binding response regulator, OmpR family, contains REC and winged-helix (wHTH) domain [Paraburkholderia phenazinium]